MTTLPPSYELSIKRSKKPMMAPDCFPRPVTVIYVDSDILDTDSETTDVCNMCQCDFDTDELTICDDCGDTICDNCNNDNSFKYKCDNRKRITHYYCESCYIFYKTDSDSD